ncbi:hypothetical protein HRR83_004522 [Exophiala dermatitidis]|uniref:Short chain dehydrogenase/reductase n=2 Tax=Exophiala dermatitidis TaxID=5970 RepID=H6BQW7_EXODN|nr:short chain dehydrogenase/reductase [Exophiala dermatitidis NIH/UT8656]KAJ4515761.1 hypothetical protein HRR75_003843 [Exophiala dermatitidis]EHY53880.1 short chain dehydrogenase/reductase [Exophiala dermatitidis NIH/UT8656]KAJ4519453.1 hypothetical protein HRR74_004197 [Exophiala dermatitidis]KAJ4529269.1 hypothetical protein HRR73_000292 [Exophiala dermatitidis]KAJ4544078.1 hypothetical protein HRR76_002149 [Exophiala dermatitidis]
MASPSTSVFRPGTLAFITGSASGVGFAFAQHCRRQGMHVALADINSDNLEKAKTALQAITPNTPNTNTSPQILTYTLDVSDLSAWTQVKSDLTTNKRFSTINFLMLNAGMSMKPSTSTPWDDAAYFHKTLATNFFGVVHGLATLLPLVTDTKSNSDSSGPSAIVITGSKQGITNPPGNPAYNASKAAVKVVAEQLAHDLRSKTSTSQQQVSVHLLVPGWTFTGLSGNQGPVPDEQALNKKPRGAWLPSQVVEYGVKKINAGKFYIICPDTDVDEALDQARMAWAVGDIIEGRSALSRWDQQFKFDAAKAIAEDAERRRGAKKA